MNKAILRGNLGVEPTLRYTSTGKPVCNFRMATNERYNDAQGVSQQRTEWHRVVVWGKAAENCKKYLTKGSAVFIDGNIRTNQWDDKEGQKRYTTEIHTVNVQFMDSKGGASESQDDNPPVPDDPELEDLQAEADKIVASEDN